MTFSGILSDQLGLVWNDAKPFLEKALAPGETIEDILTKLFLQRMQLWVAHEGPELQAAMTTEIVIEPNRKIVNLCHLGGRGVNNWLGYLDTIEAWAKSNGCTAVTVSRARPGWKRLMRDYRTTHVILEKAL